MTYIQCNFCNSMVDADLYLLQVCCTRVPPDVFLNALLDKFRVRAWASFSRSAAAKSSTTAAPRIGASSSVAPCDDHEHAMAESMLTFLATLLSVRTNLGLSDLELNRLEMVTLLCMGDKTHSQLMELMPERCGTSQQRDFESLLASVADYRAPNLEASGNMQQGMYAPKPEAWERRYDPLHVLLRAVHRRDFQTSMDRYADHVRQTGKLRAGSTSAPWPPFRAPAPCADAYEDPCKLLRSRVFHAIAFAYLHRAVAGRASEHVTALVVYLLDVAVSTAEPPDDEQNRMCSYPSTSQRVVSDGDLHNWYASDCLAQNLHTIINKVVLTPEPEVSPITYSSEDSDVEWGDGSEVENDASDASAEGNVTVGERAVLMLEQSEGGDASTISSVALALHTSSRDDDDFEDDTPTRLALPPAETGLTVALMTTEPVDEATLGRPALPPAMQRPAVLMGNEVGRAPALAPLATSTEVVPSTSTGGSGVSGRKPFHAKRRQIEGSSTTPPKVVVNESIISLLLKLHSQLSGVPDSYDPAEQEANVDDDGCVGDGPFFVAKLLRKIAAFDRACNENIREVCIYVCMDVCIYCIKYYIHSK